jgi:hypothetical protein
VPPSLRSLADDLRLRTDAEINELLRLRPDLLAPIPTSISELAKSANTAESVSLALGELTATDLTVLEACCALAPDQPVTVETLSDGLCAEAEPVTQSARTLWKLALIWGPADDLRPPAAVRESMGPNPCGLDQVVRSAAAVANEETLAAIQKPHAFDDAPANTHELLRELTWQAPVIAALGGTAPPTAAWLYERGILKLVGESSFALPRETSLALRHGHLLPTPLPTQPAIHGKSWPRSLVESTAGHSADLFLRTLDRIVESVRLNPPSLLGRGGLASRDWQSRAADLRIPVAQMATALEVGWQAGWIADNGAGSLLPTTSYLETADNPRAQRWADLAMAWLQMPRRPWQNGPQTVGRNAVTPLSPELADEQIPVIKAHLLEALVAAESSLPPAVILPWLVWRQPRLNPSAQVVSELISQAETLGITGLGAISRTGDLVAQHASRNRIGATITPLLPELSDRFVLQADHTATATSPLTARAERRLGLVAEFESGGGATVYRFTHKSVARGLAHGERPEDLTSWLRESSDTNLPRSIEVLIEDAARAQGEVAVAAASATLQASADTIDKIVVDPEFGSLGLVRLSDDVVCTQVGPEELLARLQSAGYATHRLTQDPEPASTQPEWPNAISAQSESEGLRKRVIAALRQIEKGVKDLTITPQPLDLAHEGPMSVPEFLTNAAANRSPVQLEFSDDSGSLQSHAIDPITVSGGTATVFDRTTNSIRSIPLSRVLSATYSSVEH